MTLNATWINFARNGTYFCITKEMMQYPIGQYNCIFVLPIYSCISETEHMHIQNGTSEYAHGTTIGLYVM